MTPYFDFRTFDDHASVQSQGSAIEGRVELSAGSMVQRAILHVHDQWKGRVACGQYITIWIFFEASEGNTFFWETFRGKVSRVRPQGDSTVIEAVSYAAALLTTDSSVKGWHNATSADVLSDLLSAASLSLTNDMPSVLSGKVLHVWNTEGSLLAYEIASLLSLHHSDLVLHSDHFSNLLLATRATLAQLYPLLAFPSDSSLRELGSEFERVEFSLRPATAYQAVFDPFSREFLGTADMVVQQIRAGRGVTELILDRTADAQLSSYVDSNAPTFDPAKATP